MNFYILSIQVDCYLNKYNQAIFLLHVSIVWEKEECLILVLNHFYKEGVTRNLDW